MPNAFVCSIKYFERHYDNRRWHFDGFDIHNKALVVRDSPSNMTVWKNSSFFVVPDILPVSCCVAIDFAETVSVGSFDGRKQPFCVANKKLHISKETEHTVQCTGCWLTSLLLLRFNGPHPKSGWMLMREKNTASDIHDAKSFAIAVALTFIFLNSHSGITGSKSNRKYRVLIYSFASQDMILVTIAPICTPLGGSTDVVSMIFWKRYLRPDQRPEATVLRDVAFSSFSKSFWKPDGW